MFAIEIEVRNILSFVYRDIKKFAFWYTGKNYSRYIIILILYCKYNKNDLSVENFKFSDFEGQRNKLLPSPKAP